MRTLQIACVFVLALSLFIGSSPMASHAQDTDLVPASLCQPRLGLGNVFAKLKAGKPVTIAYFGGSITAANGWRVKTFEWFKSRYPQSALTAVDAAIGGTGSDLGAFRCQYDVLQHHPDLIFVEFAVNDGGMPKEAIWRQMEGIVRQARSANPAVDICYVYTFRVGYEAQLAQGLNPPAASADEKLAQHYGIPSINVALATVQAAQAGKLIYEPQKGPDGQALAAQDGVLIFSNDGVHPVDKGHDIYAKVIEDALVQMEPMPAHGDYPAISPFVADNWQNAKQVAIQPSMLTAGWTKLDPTVGIGRDFSERLPQIWEATKPGEALTFKFKGTTALLYDLMGPNSGQAIITIDNQPSVTRACFDKYCSYVRLATLMIGSGMPDTVHTVRVEVSPVQPDRAPASSQEKQPYDPKKYDGTVLRFGTVMLIGDIVP